LWCCIFSNQNLFNLFFPPSLTHTQTLNSPNKRSGDFVGFVAAYGSAPRMAPYLLDGLLPRVRARALRTIAAAYAPLPLPLSSLAEMLGFDTPEEAGGWAAAQGAAVDARRGQLLTRESRAGLVAGAAPAGASR
jgi:hypothetical protein